MYSDTCTSAKKSFNYIHFFLESCLEPPPPSAFAFSSNFNLSSWFCFRLISSFLSAASFASAFISQYAWPLPSQSYGSSVLKNVLPNFYVIICSALISFTNLNPWDFMMQSSLPRISAYFGSCSYVSDSNESYMSLNCPGQPLKIVCFLCGSVFIKNISSQFLLPSQGKPFKKQSK